MSRAKIRDAIVATEKIRKITKAMQLVSANHLHKSVSLANNSRPYLVSLQNILNNIINKHNDYTHPFFIANPLKHQLIIVYSTDKGLCGALNLNVFKVVVEKIMEAEKNGISTSLVTIGSKATNFFSKKGIEISASVTKVSHHPHVQDIAGILKVISEGYLNDEWQKVYLIYPKYYNTMSQLPYVYELLPLQSKDYGSANNNIDYVYEPGIDNVMNGLLDRLVESSVYQALLELLASEQASRMVAMQQATDNADECKKNLEKQYHKIRQSVITREIAEITAGADCL